jgi:hypothetical protein
MKENCQRAGIKIPEEINLPAKVLRQEKWPGITNYFKHRTINSLYLGIIAVKRLKILMDRDDPAENHKVLKTAYNRFVLLIFRANQEAVIQPVNRS